MSIAPDKSPQISSEILTAFITIPAPEMDADVFISHPLLSVIITE